MKIFIFSYDSTSKTRKKTVDCFLIFFLVPRDIGIQRSVKLHQNYGENGEICDVSRFTCQQADYVINNNLITTCNNGMKFCRSKEILSPRQQCRSQIPFKDFIICTLITSVDEIHQLFYEKLLKVGKVVN